jgi:hypothetical protein
MLFAVSPLLKEIRLNSSQFKYSSNSYHNLSIGDLHGVSRDF